MYRRTLFSGALCASLLVGAAVPTFAKPTTRPTTVPTTEPGELAPFGIPGNDRHTRAEKPTTVPAPAPMPGPSTKTSADPKKFPSPKELWAKYKAQQAAVDKMARIAYFDLNQPVAESPAAFSLFGDNTLTIRDLVTRLHQARDDKGVRAVLINIGGTSMNLAQAQELRKALDEIRRAGKRSFVYADSYDTDTYVAASGATDVCMLGGGEIMMPGVGLETMFYKGLFDKLGVQADYVQIGEYKGADESYTRAAPSAELKGELNKLTDGIYKEIVDGISHQRNIPKEDVKRAIDDAIIPAKEALNLKLVDHLLDQDSLRGMLKDEMGQDVNLVADYGAAAHEKPDFSNPMSLFLSLTKKSEVESDKPEIAVIYAEGMIVDGEAESGLFSSGGTIGSEDLRRAFRLAARDEKVKAIVLRIDSPGGSALASEVMWQAAHHAAEKKPLIISVGSMAASGGYYLASSGDYIFADPTAIVGSIGVVGGKFVLKDLFAKVGITTEEFTRGRNADLFSMNQPFTDKQRRMVTNWMRQTYDQFTDRVKTGRMGKIKDVDDVARGRIFVAKQAEDLGLVDALGGIDDAVKYAASDADLQPGTYDVKVIPAPRTLADLFNGGGDDEGHAQSKLPIMPKIEIGPDSLLRALPAPTRELMGRQLLMMQMLQARPVMLVCPYQITVR